MSTLKVATIQDTSGNNSSTPEQVAQGRAKAWVNFNGSGTVAFRDDFNFSSITDLGVGYYSLNFTTSMANANYCTVIGTRSRPAGNVYHQITTVHAQSTSAVQITHQQIEGSSNTLSMQDTDTMHCAVFGD